MLNAHGKESKVGGGGSGILLHKSSHRTAVGDLHRRNSYGGEASSMSDSGESGSCPSSPSPSKLRTGAMVEVMEVLEQLEDPDVLQVIAAVAHKNGEKGVGGLLFCLAQRRGRENELLETILRLEVRSTPKPELLFREESLCTQILNAALNPYFVPYFQKTVLPILAQAETQGLNVEIDPVRMIKIPSEKELSEQRGKLEKFTENIMRAVYNSTIPPGMSHIFKIIYEVVTEKFEDYGRLGVSSFLFLRLICVTILNASSPTTARTFLLAAKIIQNLANEVKFQKELHMLEFNKFLERHKQPLEDFYTKLLANENTYLISSSVVDKYLLLKEFQPLGDFIQQYFFPMRRECRGSPNAKRTMEIMKNLCSLGRVARSISDITSSAAASVSDTIDGLQHSSSEPLNGSAYFSFPSLLRSHTLATVPSPTSSVCSTGSEDDTSSDCSTVSTGSLSSSTGSSGGDAYIPAEVSNAKRMSSDNLSMLLHKPFENEKRLSSEALNNLLKRNISRKDLMGCKSHKDLASLGFNFKDRQLLLRFISEEQAN